MPNVDYSFYLKSAKSLYFVNTFLTNGGYNNNCSKRKEQKKGMRPDGTKRKLLGCLLTHTEAV